MRKFIVIFFLIAIGVISSFSFLNKRGYLDEPLHTLPPEGQSVVLATPDPYLSSSKTPKEVPFKVEEYSTNLKIPWGLVFTARNRILVTERDGKIRAVVDGKLMPKPLIVFGEVAASGEGGLLGIALDPSYETNKFVYVMLSYGKAAGTVEKIVRLTDLGDSIIENKIIFDNIPAAQYHDGGALRFGPDGKLYVSTGDATSKDNAQKIESVSGKILRINSDGSLPSDNPFPNSPVYSLGHRNPQGFDWYPDSNVMFATEHGPSTFDGPPGGDEVNVIESGGNYGWPVVSHERSKEGMVSPKIVFTPAFAPASGTFYKGKVFPQFFGNFFFGGLAGEGIMRVIVEPKGPSKILSYGKLAGINFGRIRNITEGPDGFIYFTTSNLDGRGKPRDGDDKIYRIVPASKK